MVKESMRKCSHCGHNGHNARTCNEKGTTCSMKLFGVRIVADGGNNVRVDESQPMRKCVSLGNLELKALASADAYDGYLSDGPVHSLKRTTTASERKKGVPWSMEEHRDFLAGLEKLGKGDWRGISKNFVTTRTPTQVASHAQKYFIRIGLSDKKKKKRSSLFDLPHQNNAIATELPSPSLTDKTPPVAPSPTANVSPPPPMTNVSAQHAKALYPVAAGASNLHEVPYMVRFPSQSFPAAGTFTAVPMPLFPVMKFPSQGPVYAPSSANFLTCAPIASFPAVGSTHHQPSHPAQPLSARRDGLELGIALPENQDVSNLSSGPIRVI